jgi:glycosyltransferase involved in cell wall biosynthesis
LKRLDLLVEAAGLARDHSLAFKIAGEGEEEPRLRERIRDLGLEGRVELLGSVTDAQLVDHYARCRAVYFAPWNEDYGFVTLEAFRSGKAVVTATDSGGPAELVRHGENGFVSAPTAEALAADLDALGRDRGLAERLGQAARRDAEAFRWERTVEELLRGA